MHSEDYTEEGSEPGAKVGLSRSMLETSCSTACLSDPELPQALLTAPSACSRDAPDSSNHLGDSGSHACSSQACLPDEQNRLPNVENRFYCPQAFLNLDFHFGTDVLDLK